MISDVTPPTGRGRGRRFIGRVVAAIVAVAVVGVTLAYPIADWSRATLDDSARQQLIDEGKADTFVTTSEGVMHVRVTGPADGPIILLIHGGVVGGYGYENWREPLAAAGYRVIVPDLLGYGYSDRPATTYDRDFYLSQIHDLIDGLGIDEPINLVGASFGGIIATEYTAAHPEQIATLALMAPAGLGAREDVAPILLQPVIGDWVFRLVGGATVTGQMADAYEGSPDKQAMLDWMNEQTRFRGYGESLLASLRDWKYQWSPDAYRTVGETGIPVFAAWGTEDVVHPYERAELLEEFAPQTQLLTLEGAGHAITYGRAADVLAGYLPFLDSSALGQASPEH